MKDKYISLHKYSYAQVQEIIEVLEILGGTIYNTTRKRVTNWRNFPLSPASSECNTLVLTDKEGWMGYSNSHSILKKMEEIRYEEILRYHPKLLKSKIKLNSKTISIQIL